MQTTNAIAEALATIQAMKTAQPGLHTDTLADGFSALWNEKEELRLDKIIALNAVRESMAFDTLAALTNPTTQLSSQEWADFLGVSVTNPAGWDRNSEREQGPDFEVFAESWLEPISRQEFMRRVALSTVHIYDWSVLLDH